MAMGARVGRKEGGENTQSPNPLCVAQPCATRSHQVRRDASLGLFLAYYCSFAVCGDVKVVK